MQTTLNQSPGFFFSLSRAAHNNTHTQTLYDPTRGAAVTAGAFTPCLIYLPRLRTIKRRDLDSGADLRMHYSSAGV